MSFQCTLGFLGPIGWQEMIILGIVGVLVFGKRLPEVGKSLGKGIVEFKRGLQGIDEDVDRSVNEPPKADKHLEDPAARGDQPLADQPAPESKAEQPRSSPST